MTILPVPSSPSDQWVLNDGRQQSQTSQAAAGGVASVSWGPVPDNELWLVERMVVSCSSTTTTTCTLYTDLADVSHAQDYTLAGNFDVADENSPILVPSNSILIAQWSGASVGAIGTARAQFRIMRRPAI